MRWQGSATSARDAGHLSPPLVVEVPVDAGATSAGTAPKAFTQAERARRALVESRHGRAVPLDRAFLLAALDQRAVMRTLVAAAVPRFADWCLVDLVDGNGIPRRVEVAHGDAARADLARELRVSCLAPGWATPGTLAIRDHAPRLFREVGLEVMRWMTHDARDLALLRALAPNSMVCVPLVARERAIGAITLFRSTTFPAFDEDDLAFALELAAPAALALAAAGAHQAERAGRASAEALADRERAGRLEAERAALRLRRLESLATALSPALAPSAIARLAVEDALSTLAPSTATVVRAAPAADRLEVLHAAGWPDDLARELPALPADARALVAEAWRVEAAIWLPEPDALLAAHPAAAEHARRLGAHAWAAVPLRADGRTLGALELGFPRPRELDPDERRFLLAVAQLAAQALERARLRGG